MGSVPPVRSCRTRGQFPCTYPQSEFSYARRRAYVSLFDFQTPSELQIVEVEHCWENFFSRHQPASVWLLLDRARLAKLQPWTTAREGPYAFEGTRIA